MVSAALLLVLIVGSLLSGWALAARVMGERDPLLVGALTPLIAVFLVLFLANWQLPPIVSFVPALALLLPQSGTRSAPRSRATRIFLTSAALLVFGYSCYAERRFVDGDSWIHDPLIASYMQHLFPPHNPFFPALEMHGHYGRDLLMAALTPLRGDPTRTMWLVVPILQVATFLGLFALVERAGSQSQAALVTVMIFFGVDVGFRVGLIDSWDGNHPVVNAGLVLCLYLMHRVYEGRPGGIEPLFWLVAGAILGLYQVVYETYFGVLLLTGLIMALLFVRSRRAWVGVLTVAAVALGTALVEGGTLTEMAHRQKTLHDTAYLSESQQVSVHFPKRHLFEVAVTEAGYQRISAAFTTRLFRGWVGSPTGSGYMSIFAPRFLTSHWLPLYLAPFTLAVLLWRKEKPRVALSLWIFGVVAYLVPGLVDFGEVWEWEYFRWEMAAGVGLAGALGAALALLLEGEGGFGLTRRGPELSLTVTPRAARVIACLLVLVGSLAAGEKTLGDALIDIQKRGLDLTLDADRWRTRQSEFGLTEADTAAMGWLRQRSRAGDRFLSNLGSELPEGIWPDCEIATRGLVLPAGHALPSRSEAAHAHPPYQWDGLRRAFWQTGRPEMLTGIEWLYADPATLAPAVLASLGEGQSFSDPAGHRRTIWRVTAAPTRSAGSRGVELELGPRPPDSSLRVATCYHVDVTLRNQTDTEVALGSLRARVVAADGSDFGETPLTILPPASLPPHGSVTVSMPFVTPLDEGDFSLEVALIGADGAAAAARTVPLEVNFLTRVRALAVRLDLPDHFAPRRFYQLRLGFTAPAALDTDDELECALRLRRAEGEYVWELDLIPQPLPLKLKPGVEQVIYLQMLTPSAGPYDLEVQATEKISRRVIPLLKKPVRINVAE